MHSVRYFVSFFFFFVSLSVRAGLLPSELNTIHVFQSVSPKVVSIQRLTSKTENHQKIHVPTGSGSGIIWDNLGHVVTNYHVIKGADRIAIGIGDVMASAKIVGIEPRKDLAVLLIETPKVLASLKSFKPLELAPTDELVVGQQAIVIGHPFGFEKTLTIGVVSALNREFPGIGGVSIHHAIQTDASINPGNSGGPLLDSQGRLMGLNTALFSQSGISSGIGFAVSANDIAKIVPQLIHHGHVALAGIGIQRADNALAKRLGVQRGILIAKVLPHTPAARAGLVVSERDKWGRMHLGDIVLSVNSQPIDDADAFYNTISALDVGTDVLVTVLHQGKEVTHKMKTIDIAAYG